MADRPRRAYGTGSLLTRSRADGLEDWYGRWRVGHKRLNRRIGPKKRRGTDKGLSRSEAEGALRSMMIRERPAMAGSDIPFRVVADLMLDELEELGRKSSTLDNYRTILRSTLLPRIGDIAVGDARPSQIEAIATELLDEGKAARTRAGALKLLSQVFTFAQRRGWCPENPCRTVRRPRLRESTDIRFLSREELEALLAAIDLSEKPFGSLDHAIFLTAAMTGMRQGELLALRWRDVDWKAKRVRVRRNYVRGHWDTPKSRSGERSVPMATKVAVELRRHRVKTRFSDPDDLVFAHPETGVVLPHGPLVRRFKKALKAADVRPVRFHDLRHTFATRIAASGAPIRMLQEWMGHRDYRTTLIYADYQPGEDECAMVDEAFA